jgi:TPR repeat protein
MYRLGTAELNGNLGLAKRPKEGVKWLKRSADHATEEFPHALHELALLHERGIDNVLFVDLEYSAELLASAAELSYAPSAYKLGECYEYGKMGCPMDAALSIHYYVRFFPLSSISFFSALKRELTMSHSILIPHRTSPLSKSTERRALP